MLSTSTALSQPPPLLPASRRVPPLFAASQWCSIHELPEIRQYFCEALQFHMARRLDEVSRCSQLIRVGDVRFDYRRSKNHQRRERARRVLFEPLQKLKPVHDRHFQVAKNQVRPTILLRLRIDVL